MGIKAAASKNPKAPHAAEQVQEEEKLSTNGSAEEAQFIASVEGWVEHVGEAIRGRGDKNYESNAAASFVGTALQVLRRGRWQQLEQAPEDYGIPAELLEDLQEYKQANEEVLQIARIHEELAKRVYTALLKGEPLEVKTRRVQQGASSKQDEEGREKGT